MDPMIGRKIQDYEVVSLLGSGGMGEVYLAQHPLIGKQVAIKALRPELSTNEEALTRFFQEAKAVNEIRHENLVDVINFYSNVATKEHYIMMEYLEGKSLLDTINAESPLPTTRMGHIALQVCSALSAAHAKNIVHRDLKSENLLLLNRAGQRDFVKILDFGLAKLESLPGANRLSQDGIALGTPSYMSPEQALGEPVDGRTDVYALGVILYEMATKFLPFTAFSIRDVMQKQIFGKLTPPRERYAGVDPKLEAVIIRCLEKKPADRYPSMRALALALGEACELDAALYFGQSLASARGESRRSLPAVSAIRQEPTQEFPIASIPEESSTQEQNQNNALPDMKTTMIEVPETLASGGTTSIPAVVVSTSQASIVKAKRPLLRPRTIVIAAGAVLLALFFTLSGTAGSKVPVVAQTPARPVLPPQKTTPPIVQPKPATPTPTPKTAPVTPKNPVVVTPQKTTPPPTKVQNETKKPIKPKTQKDAHGIVVLP
jgi:serine/threonine protein kinase